MTESGIEGLRGVVAEAVREAVAELVGASVRQVLTDGSLGNGSAPGSRHEVAGPREETAPLVSRPPSVRRTNDRARTETVRIDDDTDLDTFARHLLELFDNPKNRQDLRAGRIRFQLAHSRTGPAPQARVRRIESGAVTERQVKQAADAQESILLGARAVLTPLGRERARALGVPVEKER